MEPRARAEGSGFGRSRFRTEEWRCVALMAGALALVGPRRTRPLAGFVYGVALSRVHGAARIAQADQIGAVIGRLFSEKTSVGARVDRLEALYEERLGLIARIKEQPDAT